MSLIDRRLLDIRLTVHKIANEPEANPTAGIQYIVGAEGSGVFEGIAPNSIAWYDGTNWKFAAPSPESTEVLNAETGEILRYNGTAWVAVVSVNSGHITEKHTLSSSEVTAKSFSLENSVKTGQENNVLLFISGIAQVAGIDFSISGSSISWNEKGLDNIGLLAGDTFIIHYISA